jgi:hypothetical protein
MSVDFSPILSGTYRSSEEKDLPFTVTQLGDKLGDKFGIFFVDKKDNTIYKLFPQWKGLGFMINKDDFENFKKNVVNNPLAVWKVTKIRDDNVVEVPGFWTMETSGGKKRGHKRRKSHKRSGHKRSKSHKRSGKSRRH